MSTTLQLIILAPAAVAVLAFMRLWWVRSMRLARHVGRMQGYSEALRDRASANRSPDRREKGGYQ